MAERFQQTDPEMKGWLYKWTNYLKGYQKRWFVLSNGLLSYYRNPMEMSQSCRGTISLVSAVIHTEDSCNFVIANGGTQTFHLKATNEIERQKWVTALELAKVRAIRLIDSEDDDIYDINNDKNELQSVLKSLSTKLETLHTCHDVIIKHGSALQRSLIELEQLDNPNDAMNKSKTVNERATLFRITSSAMINASAEYLTLAQTHGRKWQKLLQHEHESRIRLYIYRLIDSEDDNINNDKNELQSVLKSLSTKLETLETCNDIIIKHGSALQRSIRELEQLDNPNDAINESKTVNERATLFQITSNAMINASAEYLTLAQNHGRKWQKLLQKVLQKLLQHEHS